MTIQRKKLNVALAVVFVILTIVTGCKNEPEYTGYSTPTITGTVSLPNGSGFKPSDVWVKV